MRMQEILILVAVGTLLGFVFLFWAVSQQWAVWKSWGFSKPKTNQERQIVLRYAYSRPRLRSLIKAFYIIPILGSAVYLILSLGEYFKDTQIIAVTVPFVVTVSGGYFLSAHILDSIIRKKSSRKKRV